MLDADTSAGGAAATGAAPEAAKGALDRDPEEHTEDGGALKKSKSRAPKRPEAKRDTRASKRLREAGGSDAGAMGASAGFATVPKKVFYSDLGGIEDVLTDIRQLIEYPLMHPEVPHPSCRLQPALHSPACTMWPVLPITTSMHVFQRPPSPQLLLGHLIVPNPWTPLPTQLQHALCPLQNVPTACLRLPKSLNRV